MTFKESMLGPENGPEQLTWLQRKETWSGDKRSNAIRAIAIAIFGVHELVNYYGFHGVDLRFHQGSMLIVFLWLLASAVFHRALRDHWLPRSGPFISAAIDVLLLTWLLFFADGPQSALTSLYFLIIALTAFRVNPPLTLFTGAVSTFGYLAVLEFTKLHRPQYLVPVDHAVLMTLCLLLMGMIVAHGVARVVALLKNVMVSGTSA